MKNYKGMKSKIDETLDDKLTKPNQENRKSIRERSILKLSDDLSINPTLFHGWVRLAEAYFIKKEYLMACECYDTALMIKNGKNKFDRKIMSRVISKGNNKEIIGMLKRINDFCWQDLRHQTK